MIRGSVWKISILLIVSMFMFACAKEAPPEPTPVPAAPEPVPEVPEAPEPEELVEEPAEEPEIMAEGEYIISRIDAPHGRMIQSLVCDDQNRLFQVTLTNPTQDTFALKRISALAAASEGLNILTATLNGRLLITLDEICGSETLAPGETVTCEQEFVPNVQGRFMIRTGDDELGKTLINYLRIKTLSGNHEVMFKCM